MPTLTVDHIVKGYDGNPVIRDMSFTVEPGKILALCGENGAGKSTLMKVLSGATLPDAGLIMLDGQAVTIKSPAEGMELGIHTVYQELSLLRHLSVAENILLGQMPTKWNGTAIDWKAANELAHSVLVDFGFPEIDPAGLVGNLSVAQQQIIEIAKALVAKPDILILDEPTAVLSEAETRLLFKKMRALTAAGTTILYISHRLEEVFEMSDEVVVLKDGRSVLQGKTKKVTQPQLVEAMVGRPLSDIFPPRKKDFGPVVLDVRRLGLEGVFADIDFKVRSGEIVGMFGLVGSGRTEVLKAVFGAYAAGCGEVYLDGNQVFFSSPCKSVKGGFALITEDRKGDGLALDASILDNASLAGFARYSNWGVIETKHRDKLVNEKMRELEVRPPGTARPVRQLSGGNQQKVVLAKWLIAPDIRVYIFDEPTRGVDIGTKVEIYKLIAGLAAKGAAIVLISSEMPEVLGMANRLLIMRDGRIVAELMPDEFHPELVFAHAAGLNTDNQSQGEMQS